MKFLLRARVAHMLVVAVLGVVAGTLPAHATTIAALPGPTPTVNVAADGIYEYELQGTDGDYTIVVPFNPAVQRVSIHPATTSSDPLAYRVTLFAGSVGSVGNVSTVSGGDIAITGVSLRGNAFSDRINLTRVQVLGGRFEAGAELKMEFCDVLGGSFKLLGGIMKVTRCTVRSANFDLGSFAGQFNGNLFISPPPNAARVTGTNNYYADSTSGIETDSSTKYILGPAEVSPVGGPIFRETGWTDGLTIPLVPLASLTVGPPTTTNDFENEPTSSNPLQIGADQAPDLGGTLSLGFPTVSVVANPARLTDTVGTLVRPIVKGSDSVDITVVVNGLFSTVPSDAYGIVIVGEASNSSLNPLANFALSTRFIPFSAATQNTLGGTNLAATFVFEDIGIGTLDPSGAHAFDGDARIWIAFNVAGTGATITADYYGEGAQQLGNVTMSHQHLLIDTKPPYISGPIESASVRPTGTGITCPTTTPLDAAGAARAPQVVVSTPALGMEFSVGLTDGMPPAVLGSTTTVETSGFETAPLFPGGTTYTDVGVDGNFGHLLLGAAEWRTDFIPFLNPTYAQDSALTPTWGFIAPSDGTAHPFAFSWSANLFAYDRANNISENPVPVNFWWMPPGSTWARVVNDTLDPNHPAFSWDLAINSTSGSASNFNFDCLNPPVAQMVVCRAIVPSDIENSGWEKVNGMPWTDWTTNPSVSPTTIMGDGNTLEQIVKTHRGDAVIVVCRMTDPAGNVQDVGTLDGSPSTSLTLTELELNKIFYAGPYLIPTNPSLGALDTSVSARYFLNRTDRADESRLFEVDDDETTFGSGPNIPLTPTKACGQRIEGEFIIDYGVPDALQSQAISVEFKLYENGKIVARGNLNKRNDVDPTLPMRLYIPTDIIDAASDRHRNQYTDVFLADATDFLNEQPLTCAAVNGLVKDRLGDDGRVYRTGELDENGEQRASFRSRPVTYTLELMATDDQFSSTRTPDPSNFVYDPSPATISFTVQSDANPDSEPPRVKINEKVSDARIPGTGILEVAAKGAVLARESDSVFNTLGR